MIREIRTLQSADQNRLRDDHKHDGARHSFARYLDNAAPQDEALPVYDSGKKQPENTIPKTLPGHQALWGSFFEQLSQTANDGYASDPLFSWGEMRENARRHTALARQSANFNGDAIDHALNKKI